MKRDVLIAIILKHIKTLDKKSPNFLYEVRAYNILIKKLGLYTIVNHKIIESMDITQHMKTKLNQWIKMDKSINLQDSEDFEYKLLTLPGIGSKLAKQLIESGITSIAKLKNKRIFNTLPIATQTDLIYKPLRRIPRYIIEYVESITKSYKLPFVYVGSYRRDSSSSSDIDVLTKKKIPADFINQLNDKIGDQILFYEPYAFGDSKISLILKVKKYKVNVKMDIFITTPKEYPFALLYSTGSKEFNIMMRGKCKKLGLLLNQKGLYRNTELIDCKTERDIFSQIELDYVLPKHR